MADKHILEIQNTWDNLKTTIADKQIAILTDENNELIAKDGTDINLYRPSRIWNGSAFAVQNAVFNQVTLTESISYAAEGKGIELVGEDTTSVTLDFDAINLVVEGTAVFSVLSTGPVFGNLITVGSVISGTAVTGTNQSANDLIIQPGASTGTGKSVTRIKRMGVGTTGTTANTASDAIVIAGRKDLVDATPTPVFEIAVASNSTAACIVMYKIHCFDGTNLQSESGVLTVVACNKAGTVTSGIAHSSGVGGLEIGLVTSGTMTDDFTTTNGTGKVTVNFDIYTSLSATQLWTNFTIFNQSTGNITLL
jgi:hypothetical protein